MPEDIVSQNVTTEESPIAPEPIVPETQVEPNATLAFDAYTSETKIHYGLIASFKAENKDLTPRSRDAWEKAFEDQSKKVYGRE